MTKPLDRPEALLGRTYKIKWLESDHAFYITINDIEKDGRRRPFEVFINSKNMEAYAWALALTRMISAVFRRGGDVSFVVDELKAIFDPRGGQWMGGRYVPSLLAAIGEVIERHMIEIGFMGMRAPAPVQAAMPREGAPAHFCPRCGEASLCMSKAAIPACPAAIPNAGEIGADNAIFLAFLAVCAAGDVPGAGRLGDGALVGGGRRPGQKTDRTERS
jgi:hypothetical protein